MNIIKQIQDIDVNFKETSFYEWCQKVIIELENAWSQKDIDVLGLYETDDLLAEHREQLENMQARHIQNCMADIQIKDIDIISYERIQNYDHIEVHIQLSLIDYYRDEEKDQIVSGSSKQPKQAMYRLVFEKNKMEQSHGFETNDDVCPYCGAPIDLRKSKHCDYCNRDIYAQTSVYKIAELEIIS